MIKSGNTTFINSSLVNEKNELANDPVLFEL
jgi:hypothetical protein